MLRPMGLLSVWWIMVQEVVASVYAWMHGKFVIIRYYMKDCWFETQRLRDIYYTMQDSNWNLFEHYFKESLQIFLKKSSPKKFFILFSIEKAMVPSAWQTKQVDLLVLCNTLVHRVSVHMFTTTNNMKENAVFVNERVSPLQWSCFHFCNLQYVSCS